MTPNPARLSTERVSLSYGDRPVIADLSLDIPDGQITVVVGANASGKSTLLRALARLLTPTAGTVILDGKAIAEHPTREVAKILGMLPQSPIAPEAITVRDLVARGRHPHQNWWRQWSDEDGRAIETALDATGCRDLADRDLDALSGGQRQRAWIAMAVAQETELLLLDEPTTFLDIAHQLDVLDLVSTLNREHGRTVVVVLHDLNLACRYAHHIVVMSEGRIVAEGAPREVVTPELLRSAFGVDASILDDPVTGAPVILPHRTV